MRIPIFLTTIALAANLTFAQEKPASSEPLEAAVIPVKTLSGDSFNRLAKLLGAFGAKFTADDKLRTIVVYAPKDVVAEMRKVVEQLDRPGSEAAVGRNIEMTLAFLRCSTKEQPEAAPLPADLDPVAKQLRAATQYRSIQLWDVVPVRLQEGKETSQSSRLPGTLKDFLQAYPTAHFTIRPEAVMHRDSARFVRFDSLRINLRIPFATGSSFPNQFQFSEVGLNTAGDFKEGQKTVLGKISGLDDDSAVFVVVSLKVLD